MDIVASYRHSLNLLVFPLSFPVGHPSRLWWCQIRVEVFSHNLLITPAYKGPTNNSEDSCLSGLSLEVTKNGGRNDE